MDLDLRRVVRPASLPEAVALLAAEPGARALAGGTDLVVQLRDGRRRAEVLVDLGRLPLDRIAETGGELEIGALATMATVAADPLVGERCPAVAEAAGLVGAWPVQCRATLGGNLANASPAADTAPPLLVAGARAVIASPHGERTVPLEEFFLGPGRTVLAAGDLLVAVRVPREEAPAGAHRVERFTKVGARREQIIATVSLAGRLWVAEGRIAACRIALGAVAPTPVRALGVEAFLAGRTPDAATRRRAVELLQRDIAPIDDVRAPARYRRLAAAVLLDRLLKEVTSE